LVVRKLRQRRPRTTAALKGLNGVPEQRLTPRDIIFFAPLGDVRQGFVAESVPDWFDVVPLKRALEVPDRTAAMAFRWKILVCSSARSGK
jgi:hypothetical protein